MLPFHQLLLHSCNANLQMSPPKMFQTFPNKCHIAVPDIKNKDCKDCPLTKSSYMILRVKIAYICETAPLSLSLMKLMI